MPFKCSAGLVVTGLAMEPSRLRHLLHCPMSLLCVFRDCHLMSYKCRKASCVPPHVSSRWDGGLSMSLAITVHLGNRQPAVEVLILDRALYSLATPHGRASYLGQATLSAGPSAPHCWDSVLQLAVELLPWSFPRVPGASGVTVGATVGAVNPGRLCQEAWFKCR